MDFKSFYGGFTNFKTKMNAYNAGTVTDTDAPFYTFLENRFSESWQFKYEDAVTESLQFAAFNQFKLIFIKVLNAQKKSIIDLIKNEGDQTFYEGNLKEISIETTKYIDNGGSNVFKPSIIEGIRGIINLPNIYRELERLFISTFSGIGAFATEDIKVDEAMQDNMVIEWIRDLIRTHNIDGLTVAEIKKIDDTVKKLKALKADLEQHKLDDDNFDNQVVEKNKNDIIINKDNIRKDHTSLVRHSSKLTNMEKEIQLVKDKQIKTNSDNCDIERTLKKKIDNNITTIATRKTYTDETRRLTIVNKTDIASNLVKVLKNKSDIANLPKGGSSGDSVQVAWNKKEIEGENFDILNTSQISRNREGISRNYDYLQKLPEYNWKQLPIDAWEGDFGKDFILRYEDSIIQNEALAQQAYENNVIIVRDKRSLPHKYYQWDMENHKSDSALSSYIFKKYISLYETPKYTRSNLSYKSIYIYAKLSPYLNAEAKHFYENSEIIMLPKYGYSGTWAKNELEFVSNFENNPQPISDTNRVEYNKVQGIFEIKPGTSSSQLDNEGLYTSSWSASTAELVLTPTFNQSLPGGNYHIKTKIVFNRANRDINILLKNIHTTHNWKGSYVYNDMSIKKFSFSNNIKGEIIGRVNNTNSVLNIVDIDIYFSIFKIGSANYIRVNNSLGICYDGNQGKYDLKAMGYLVSQSALTFQFTNWTNNLKMADVKEIFMVFKKLEGGI